jgi:hypothetical protein
MVLLKHGKNDGIAVYIPKETILKEVTIKIYLVWELSDSISYSACWLLPGLPFDPEYGGSVFL